MQAVIQMLGNLILSAQGQHSQSANLGLAYIFGVEQLKPYASINKLQCKAGYYCEIDCHQFDWFGGLEDKLNL